jgi:hypothetical protein
LSETPNDDFIKSEVILAKSNFWRILIYFILRNYIIVCSINDG